MPRVIVVTESGEGRKRRARAITLSEQVVGAHLDDEHSSVQFLERLSWAIGDAEKAEARYRESFGL